MGWGYTMKINGEYKYKITPENVVEIWRTNADEDSAPFIAQPYEPGTAIPFASAEEAEQWAEAYLTDIQLPKPPLIVPPIGPNTTEDTEETV